MLSMRDVTELREIRPDLGADILMSIVRRIAATSGVNESRATNIVREEIMRGLMRARRRREELNTGESTMREEILHTERAEGSQIRFDHENRGYQHPASIAEQMLFNHEMIADSIVYDIECIGHDEDGRVYIQNAGGRRFYVSDHIPEYRTVLNRLIMYAVAGLFAYHGGNQNQFIDLINQFIERPNADRYAISQQAEIGPTMAQMYSAMGARPPSIDSESPRSPRPRAERRQRTDVNYHDVVSEFKCTNRYCNTIFESSLSNMIDDDGHILVVCSDECYDHIKGRMH